MSDQIFWYITRSSALVAWLAAAAAVLVGLLTSSRLLGRRPTIPWLVDLHRALAALSVGFLAVHMISLWLDGFVQFGLAELVVPWVATVPGLTRTSMAYGVIAAWLLAAVQLTSLVKDRLPERLWRTVHLLSFGTLVLGSIHAVQTGSDVDNPIVVAIGVSMLTAIALATAVRLVRLRNREATEPLPPTRSTHGPASAGRVTPSPAETRPPAVRRLERR